MDKIIIRFYDENRQQHVSYSLETYFLGHEIASSIMDAFQDLTGHYNCRSRDQAWRSIKKFVHYLRNIGFNENTSRDDALTGFASFLSGNNRLRKTNGSYYNFIRRLVISMAATSENNIWSKQDFRYINFSREQECSRDNSISNVQLRGISEACKVDIAGARLKFKVREDILSGLDLTKINISQKDISNIKLLIAFEEKGVWTQSQLFSVGAITLGRSGLRKLSHYKELTFQACLPIFLLIMIQTAANPMALMEIKIDCLTGNPLDEHSADLEWFKGRASRTQKLTLMRAGNYSVPSLIELIVKMTAPIRHLAPSADKELLFIVRCGSIARRLCLQTLHDYLALFREQKALSYFTFSDIRKSIAEIVYLNTESTKEVSTVLQHKNMNTSKVYLKSDNVKQLKYERLASFQGQMVRLTETYPSPQTEEYTTVLGFSCSAPLDGYAPESRKGDPCMEFIQCATCKNAIVVVDDAIAVARIIRARNHLIEMKSKSKLDYDSDVRFNEIFNPILKIIDDDILSKIPRKTIDSAKKLLQEIPDLPVVY